MRIQQTLAAAALVLAGNPVPANNLVPALPLVKPSVVAVGTELPTRTPPVNLGGSGFAVGDGLYIVTNAHVIPPLLDIANQERIGVMIAQGAVKKFRYAKIAQVDTTHDIALLRLEGEPLPTVQLGDSDTLVEGQALAMTGYPIGMALQQMVTHRGMVSSIGPIVLPALRGQQLDVKMVPAGRRIFKKYFRTNSDNFWVVLTNKYGNFHTTHTLLYGL